MDGPNHQQDESSEGSSGDANESSMIVKQNNETQDADGTSAVHADEAGPSGVNGPHSQSGRGGGDNSGDGPDEGPGSRPDDDDGPDQEQKDLQCTSPACLRRHQKNLTHLRDKDNKIQDLEREIKGLKALLAPKRRDGTTKTPWQDQLRSLNNGTAPQTLTYEQVYKSSCQQSNIPVGIECVHPNIRLVERKDVPSIDDSSSGTSSKRLAASFAEKEFPFDRISLSSSTSSERLTAGFTGKEFPFDRISLSSFSDEIHFRILRQLLYKEDRLIHCLTRLDPFVRPEDFPEVLPRRQSGIRGRFYFDVKREVNITNDTVDPNYVLRYLLVCKKWNYYGVHCFYGLNTFAFSSLGEFGLFCNGLGAARLQRVVNLEIHWKGGKCLRWEFKDPKKASKKLNTRTSPLSWLCEMPRLKTLVLHIQETGKKVIRRRAEHQESINYMVDKTRGQPNIRLSRDLRKIVGLDYIHQLRGLSWIRIYDVERLLATKDRSKSLIRDESFMIDLNRTARMEKVPSRAIKAELKYLDPVFPYRRSGWVPTKTALDLVREIYEEEETSVRFNDLDKDATSSQDSASSSSCSDDDGYGSGGGGDSPDSNGGDSDDGSGRGARGRAYRAATPARFHVPDSDEEDDDGDQEGDDASTNIDFRRQRVNQYVRSLDIPPRRAPLSECGDNNFVDSVPRARSEGGFFSPLFPPLQDVPASRLNSRPIAISDDEEPEVQEIRRPLERHSTTLDPREARCRAERSGTSGLFCTPNPQESIIASYTAASDTAASRSEQSRFRSLGTVESRGLFVTPDEPRSSPIGSQKQSQRRSPSTADTKPVSRASSVHIDLTLLSDDEDETDDNNAGGNNTTYIRDTASVGAITRKRPRDDSPGARSEPCKRQMRGLPFCGNWNWPQGY